jgi:hypothetical protein
MSALPVVQQPDGAAMRIHEMGSGHFVLATDLKFGR